MTDTLRRAGVARPVAGTPVVLTALGAGTASLGDVFGRVADDAATEVVSACLELGVRYIDTAPLYGNGLAEQRLGRALAELGQPDVTISSKVGRTLDRDAPEGRYFDFSRDAILRGVEDSLGRLGRDHLDVLYVHDPDHHENDVYATAWPTLRQLRSEGVIGAIGFGMNQWQLPLRFVRQLGDVDIVMLAGRYTLLDTGAAEDFLPACEQAGVSVVLAGVFNSGILADPVDGAWFDYEPASREQLERARLLQRAGARYGLTLPELALAFVAAHPAATSVVVGVGSSRSLRRNVAGFEWTLPDRLLDELRVLGVGVAR